MPPRYPPVPTDLVMPHPWEIVFIIMVGVPAVLATAWALRSWRRTGDPLFAAILVGGTVCALLEPLVDLVGLCWYPRGAQFPGFELMGRPIPLFCIIGYLMTFGGCVILAIEVLRRKGPNALWAVWLGAIAFMSLFEFFAVHTKSYVYYGTQPLRVFGWPSWWGPVNSLVIIASAVVIAALRTYLRGWRTLLVIPLIPGLDAAANGAAAWPVWTTNWSDVPRAVTEVSGIVTVALAAMFVGLLISWQKLGTAPHSGSPASPAAGSSIGESMLSP